MVLTVPGASWATTSDPDARGQLAGTIITMERDGAVTESLVVVVPAVSDDQVAVGLRELTRAIDEAGLADGGAGGLFGGEWGYGANWGNDVFTLHRFCWCERDDCPWCASCECSDDAYRYFIDGQEVSVDAWEQAMEADTAEILSAIRAGEETGRAAARRPVRMRTEPIVERQCAFCRDGGKPAPNFEHHASGTKVWFYKYIGRSMDVELSAPWADVLAECFASIAAAGTADRDRTDSA